ncbi:unnamed protein product [Mesocestoides corti]|nr:unnamed protein product [Mesocestoides corti]
MNLMATYHPADKDYGHMKVDEPPTPYNFEYNAPKESNQGVSPEALASKLAAASGTLPKMLDDGKCDAEAKMTPEEAEQHRKFEEKRKKHYNEYQAVLALREAHASEDDEDDSSDFVDPIAAQNAKINAEMKFFASRNPE